MWNQMFCTSMHFAFLASAADVDSCVRLWVCSSARTCVCARVNFYSHQRIENISVSLAPDHCCFRTKKERNEAISFRIFRGTHFPQSDFEWQNAETHRRCTLARVFWIFFFFRSSQRCNRNSFRSLFIPFRQIFSILQFVFFFLGRNAAATQHIHFRRFDFSSYLMRDGDEEKINSSEEWNIFEWRK